MSLDTCSPSIGLGFRLPLADELLGRPRSEADFIEIAPENYLGVGGKRARLLHAAAERWPVFCHGLCGDLAGSAPLDDAEVEELRQFLRRVGAPFYSDHLCLTRAGGIPLHDLLPLPLCRASQERAATRIREIRDRLEMEIAVENVSAYAVLPGGEMDEITFLRGLLEEADCKLLLDVNNVFVNSVNFGFEPYDFIDQVPLERVVQIHVAGHQREGANLLLDTHAAPVCDEVYGLLEYTLKKLSRPVPILLERDHQIPPLDELESELRAIRSLAGKSDV